MNLTTHWQRLSLALFLALFAGCDGPATPPNVADNAKGAHDTATPDESKGAPKSHSHDGWWCDEHGVPEGECGQCNAKLAAEFKKKGDWCNEHDRPDSQCFVCHPELEAKFAARYEAKFGKQPPKPE